ncbi:ABC transporter substrate-binding protein [Candidatus Falkowbacteria bacterium]|jgi:NitT/TauT family transport system substrate-binding protein|nr:ABC transporter substrate-binding protein [Candidatus Falkowbacteria bacterium]MBT4432789.1 ABC transporter substrate-binding protein [Candidatus Falkowbacteria bacterium]
MNKTIKLVIVIAIVAIIAIGGALLVSQKGDLTKSQKQAVSGQPIKIGIIVYPGFAPFFIAEEKGYFEKEGVNAEVVIINDPVQAVSALAGNDVQMLFSSADFTAYISDAGVSIKEIFASDIGYGSDGLLVKNDVNSINDLKGKTVHLSMGTPSHFLLRYLTEQEGLKGGDINMIQMEADQVGVAFVAKKIDYGMSWEPWLSKASERDDGKVLFSSKDKPGIITDTFIVRSDILKSRRNDVKAVVRAWFDSIDFLEANPREANAIMAKNLGLPIEDFEAQVATVKFLDYSENLIKFDEKADLNLFTLTKEAVKIYKEDGIITKDIKAQDIVDSSVLKELYK